MLLIFIFFSARNMWNKETIEKEKIEEEKFENEEEKIDEEKIALISNEDLINSVKEKDSNLDIIKVSDSSDKSKSNSEELR